MVALSAPACFTQCFDAAAHTMGHSIPFRGQVAGFALRLMMLLTIFVKELPDSTFNDAADNLSWAACSAAWPNLFAVSAPAPIEEHIDAGAHELGFKSIFNSRST